MDFLMEPDMGGMVSKGLSVVVRPPGFGGPILQGPTQFFPAAQAKFVKDVL